MLKDDNTLERMEDHIKNHLKTELRWDTIAAQTIGVYGNALENKK